MAELREMNGDRSCILHPEHLVGRGPQCALRLDTPYVSTQHALIRWQGAQWELIDRASRNGTWLNGSLIERGRAYSLSASATMAFGHPNETWVLSCAAEPQARVVCQETGVTVFGVHGVIGLPSAQNPECSLYRGVDGAWKLELSDDSIRTIEDGETFRVGSATYRFHCPISPGSTLGAEPASGSTTVTLEFTVSSDEEYVELAVCYPERRVELGARAHNYLLLTLARARVADQSADVTEASCGWMSKDDLASGLRSTPQQIDGEIYRIRKHLGQRGVAESGSIIERRGGTCQIRLGIPSVRIQRR